MTSYLALFIGLISYSIYTGIRVAILQRIVKDILWRERQRDLEQIQVIKILVGDPE